MPMAKRTSFVVPTELRMIAAQAVADDRRLLSSLVVLALEEYLGKRGHLPEQAQRRAKSSSPWSRRALIFNDCALTTHHNGAKGCSLCPWPLPT